MITHNNNNQKTKELSVVYRRVEVYKKVQHAVMFYQSPGSIRELNARELNKVKIGN